MEWPLLHDACIAEQLQMLTVQFHIVAYTSDQAEPKFSRNLGIAWNV
jgi:hypothetical protein